MMKWERPKLVPFGDYCASGQDPLSCVDGYAAGPGGEEGECKEGACASGNCKSGDCSDAQCLTGGGTNCCAAGGDL